MARLGLAAICVATATLVAGAEPVAAARSPICTRGLTTVERDPRGLLPLAGTNPIGGCNGGGTSSREDEKLGHRCKQLSSRQPITSAARKRSTRVAPACGAGRSSSTCLTERFSLPRASRSGSTSSDASATAIPCGRSCTNAWASVWECPPTAPET
jgi:hypothetical protein